MLKGSLRILVIILFSVTGFIVFSIESEFLAVGNIKIVRPEPLIIKREDINIIIEKNGEVRVDTFYTFKNIGKYNIKSTFMFWLDKNILDNPENKLTNVKNKYIKNIKFFSDYKKTENLRAVINFDEKVYEEQTGENIQRDWYAISKVIPSNEEGYLGVYYYLINTDFEKRGQLIFSFDLVNNFNNKNLAEILYKNKQNKPGRKIGSIDYKGYLFNNIQKKNSNIQHFELLAGNVSLDGKLIINFR